MSDRRRERLRLVIFLYREGVSAGAIGAAIGMTKQGVLAMLDRAGVVRRRAGAVAARGMARSLRMHQVTALFDRGVLMTDICAQLRLSRQYVRELLAEAGRKWRDVDDRRRKDAPENQPPKTFPTQATGG